MGISVEFSHHEGGPGQQEIDLRYADALSTADNIMTFRTVVREVALSQGIWASFMPQPLTDHPGSGMHTHMSLFEGDENAFYEAGADPGRPARRPGGQGRGPAALRGTGAPPPPPRCRKTRP
jgi:glutamine synthetase